MDLKLCPACGQSVLDDDAKTCPFCGGAMDGSDKAARKPSGLKAAARPVPGDRKGAAPKTGAPGASASGSGGTSSGGAKSESKPIQAGLRSSKPQADEDDPFGVGSAGTSVSAIQALEKPEKGSLYRVVCPMCDKQGFVPKSAIGKQVRCANAKCMVPVFTVPDPDAPAADRIPKRRSTADEASAAGTAGTAKTRSPLMLYGIVGAVLLGLSVLLVQFLNRTPSDSSDLSRPNEVYTGNSGIDENEGTPGEDDATKAKAEDPQQKALAEADRMVKRMITSARLSANRDKAYARRLTGDAYLRMNQPSLAAQEFSQLLLINRQAAYYQIEPRLALYWKHLAAGDTAGAKAELDLIVKDASTIPDSGRIALEAAMGVASALMTAGRPAEAAQLVQKYQRDRSVVLNRDAMSSAAWFFTAASLRSQGKPALAVTDVFAWYDPLRTAVAVDLAARSRFRESLAWSTGSSEKREVVDSLAFLAELAAAGQAAEADLKAIETAAAEVHPMASLRIRSVIAAAKKSADQLEQLSTIVGSLTTQPPLTVPAVDQVLRMELPDGFSQRLTAAALTEYVRAASIVGDQAKAEEGLKKLAAVMFEIAPPTAETRRAVLEVESRDSEVKRRISSEMRITSESQIASTFRNYRRKVDQFAMTAEERRLSLIQKLARVVRAGGIDSVRAVLSDESNGLRQEILVDELAGLLSAAATRVGLALPELGNPDSAFRVALPERTRELQEISVGPLAVRAWNLVKGNQIPAAMKILAVGSSDLPGLREAVLNEIVQHTAALVTDPAAVYVGIGTIANYPVWREEALQAAGRIFALRGMEAAAEKWVEAQNRMPATEQVTAFYGLTLGLIERSQNSDPATAAASAQ